MNVINAESSAQFQHRAKAIKSQISRDDQGIGGEQGSEQRRFASGRGAQVQQSQNPDLRFETAGLNRRKLRHELRSFILQINPAFAHGLGFRREKAALDDGRARRQFGVPDGDVVFGKPFAGSGLTGAARVETERGAGRGVIGQRHCARLLLAETFDPSFQQPRRVCGFDAQSV